MASKITAAMLREHDACEGQVALFEQTFPKGATVTIANAVKAAHVGLDIEWAKGNLLSASAYARYSKAIKPAWDKYCKDHSATYAYYCTACGFAFVLTWNREARDGA